MSDESNGLTRRVAIWLQVAQFVGGAAVILVTATAAYLDLKATLTSRLDKIEMKTDDMRGDVDRIIDYLGIWQRPRTEQQERPA